MDQRLHQQISSHPYPLVFITISGAHLYGFPSPDSDYDLRGVHILPVREIAGLDIGKETIEVSRVLDGLQIDLVTHDAKKFLLLLLKKNGYVLEQIYSPLVLHTTPEHEELKAIARQCVTKYHCFHYFGFAATEWALFVQERKVKSLLYVYRVLLTGIHLMKTGEVEANLIRLNEEYKLPCIPELIRRKGSGIEHSELADADITSHEKEYQRLRDQLQSAHEASTLPEKPTAKAALNDLLLRLRKVV